jgi:hypothetical protein
VFRWLRRRRESEPDVDPAAELRAKLEESRAADDRDEFESGETPVDRADPDASGPAPPAPEPVDEADPEARRRAVHEQARARIDELSGTDEG